MTTTTAAIGGLNERDLKSAEELLLRFTAGRGAYLSFEIAWRKQSLRPANCGKEVSIYRENRRLLQQ